MEGIISRFGTRPNRFFMKNQAGYSLYNLILRRQHTLWGNVLRNPQVLLVGGKYMTQVRDLMSTEVEVCSLLDNIFEVAVKMKEENVGSIPIIDNERLVGMITDRDIVLRCIAEKKPPSSKVEEIMSSNLISIKPEIDTREATELMAKHQIRRLPVVEEGKLLGIVALGDFAVRQLTDEQAQAALTEISEPSGDNHLSH